MIDDDAENLTNASTNSRDQFRTQRPDFPARGTVMYSAVIGHHVRGWATQHGSEDVTAFYRVILNAVRNYMVVCVVDPSTGIAMFFVLWGFSFGKLSAVLYANAVAALGMRASRRLLGVVADHFFDDASVVALTSLGGVPIFGAAVVMQRAVGTLFKEMGYPFSVAKHVGSWIVNPWCGVVTDNTLLESKGVITVYVSPARRRAVASLCHEALVRCPPSLAKTIQGKTIWLSAWSAARALRPILQPIVVRANEPECIDTVTSPLRDALILLRDLLPHARPHVIELGAKNEAPGLVYSDAMFDSHGSVHQDSGGWLVIRRRVNVSPIVFVSFGPTPAGVSDYFVRGKRTYIGQLELVWSNSPYRTLPGEMTDMRPIHFIDNTSAVSGLIKGYSGAPDSAKVIMNQTAACVSIACSPYYYYVNTKANIADFPSRSDMLSLFQTLRGVGLEQNVVFVDPVMPDITSWRMAADELLRAQGVPTYVPVSLNEARGAWRHLVVDVRAWPVSEWVPRRIVYCGRSSKYGPVGFGNLAARPTLGLHGTAKVDEWERCVREYAIWLAAPARTYMRRRIRRELKGKSLACHCAGDGLPCHCEVIAAWANDSCLQCSALASPTGP